jgi:hypothetical protein
MTLWGWAFDPDTPSDSSAVHVYIDGTGYPVTAADNFPGLDTAYPKAGAAHGWGLTASVGPGTHTACVYAIDTWFADQHSLLGCQTVTLTPTLPIGWIDRADVAANGTLTLGGWSFDPDTPTDPASMVVTVDGQWSQTTANGSRPDVGRVFPQAGNNTGFTVTAQVGPGTHTVCAAAIDSYFPSLSSFLGCRTVTLSPNLPVGWIDRATLASNGTLTLGGWSFDPDTPATPLTVVVVIDGQWVQTTANGSRPDVGSVFPAAGNNTGFTVTAQVGPGSHTACVAAIDSYFPTVNSFLGCRTLTR